MKKVFVLILALCLCFCGCVKTEPQIDPNLIAMEVVHADTQNVVFEVTNNSKYKIEFGEDYYLEFKDGENWVPLEETNEYFFNMIAYSLEPGGWQRFDGKTEPRYGALSSGTYRVAKDFTLLNEDGVPCGSQRVYAEFEVTAIKRTVDKAEIPLEISVKSISQTEIVLSVKNFGEEIIVPFKADLYRIYGGEEIRVGEYYGYPEEHKYSALPGENEWVVDIPLVFGDFPSGKYKIVFKEFYAGERFDGRWYKEIEFEIPRAESEELDVTAKAADCDDIDINAKITNKSEKEVFLLGYREIFYETENGFERFGPIRGLNFRDSKVRILPGESIDYFNRTDGGYGVRPIGKYMVELYIEYDSNGKTAWQPVQFEFEITGFEESNIVPVWKESVDISGTVFKAKFSNGFDYEIRCGEDYFIQRLEGGDWVTVEPLGTPAFDQVIHTLNAGETAEWSTDISLIYGELSAGSYRLAKPVFTDEDNYINGMHYVFFEFKIE